MSIFKKPSQLNPKYAISALIYGTPGAGKTTLACSAPGAVLLDYDNGVTRIHGAHQVPTLQVKSWDETQAALDEIEASPEIQSVVVDTVGKMLYFMEKSIIANNSKMQKFDGSLSLQGYGVRKQMFINFIKRVTGMGKNVIFVAHDKEEKYGDATRVRPEVGGSSAADLMKELDLVGYIQMYGNERTIAFDPTEQYYAKNTCGMNGIIKLPVLIDPATNLPTGENNFLCAVIDAYQARQRQNIQQTSKYETLCNEITERVDTIDSAKDANDFAAWMQGVEHIFNTRAKAQTAFAAKVAALGLVYNKSTKQYTDAKAN